MLKFSTTEIDGGSLKFGTKGEYTLEVENPGNTEIAVNALQASCSCTQASLRDNPIPPMSSTVMTITLDSRKVGIGTSTKTVKVSWPTRGTNHQEIIKVKINVSRR